MNWIKANRNEMLLLLGSTVVTLALAAVFLQFSYYRGILPGRLYPQHYYTKDAQMGYDIVPNFKKQEAVLLGLSYDVWSNELGCFDMPYEKEQPYIYLTGDSFTWGYAPFEDKWGTLVQTLLGTRVLKCGVSGFGTKQELIKTSRDMARLPKPDLLVVGYYFGNDFPDDVKPLSRTVYDGHLVINRAIDGISEAQAEETYKNFEEYCMTYVPAHPLVQKAKCFLYNNSVLYNLARSNLRVISGMLLPGLVVQNPVSVPAAASESAAPTEAEEYASHLQNILGFKKLAAAEGSKLLFVLLPGENAYDNEHLRPFLDKEGISYLNLGPLFEKASRTRSLHWEEDIHWNVAGNHLAGLALSKFILDNDLISVADKRATLAQVETQAEKDFGVSLLETKTVIK